MDPARPDRLLAAPLRPDDGGQVDAAYARALAVHVADLADPTSYAGVLAALGSTRLLVPVVALLGDVETGADGLARDKTADMASVLLTGADGRIALLAFSSLTTLQQWDPDARPVPVAAALAAQAAVQDDAAAMVIDVAGPDMVVVQGEDLQALAEGWTLTSVGGRSAWIRPAPE
ncbi:MAG: SseB family protein [Cellulomonas sp.]|nr:SseB family protein [Cellulomonas sp.]